MSNRSYVSLAEFKAVLGITATTDDVAMVKTLEAAAREIDTYCNRRFQPYLETKHFDGRTPLWIPDLIVMAASGLTIDEDGNGTYETTFSSTDYLEYGPGIEDSLNTFPKTRLELSETSSQNSFANGIKKGVKIVGTWGYGDGTSTPYVSDTTLAASCSTSATASVNSAANLSPGMTILFESATGEQAYINSVSGTALTMERGVNGTAAAVHASGAQLYYYRYPMDVYQTCVDLATAMWQNRSRQGLQSERLGDYSYTMAGTSLNKGAIESILDDRIRHYKRVH